MQTFSENLTSLQWWLGVVAVGLVLNVTSAYLKPWLDRVMGSVSRAWATRSQDKKEQRERFVALLRERPTEYLDALANEMRARLLAIMSIALSILILVLAVYVSSKSDIAELSKKALYWFSVLIMFLAIRMQFLAISIRSALEDARRTMKSAL